MEYKVGDDVMVKAKITSVFGAAYTADCSCGNFYLKNEDILHEPQMTAEEAWEIARRICTSDYDGYDNVFSRNDLNEIFGNPDYSKIMNSFTPQEAKAKIEAWETEKEIKVGDIVRPKTTKEREYMVTYISESRKLAGVCLQTGEVIPEAFEVSADSVVKTGRHIDIEGILKQIGGTDA